MQRHQTASLPAFVRSLAAAARVPPSVLGKAYEEAGGKELALVRRVVEMGLLPEKEAWRLYAEDIGLPFLDPDILDLDPGLVQKVPEDIVRRYRAVPIREEDGIYVVAMEDPLDLLALDALQEVLGAPAMPALVPPSTLDAAIDFRLRAGRGVEALLEELDLGKIDGTKLGDPKKLREVAGEDAIVRIVDCLIEQALRRKASDIHVEAAKDFTRIRFRIDGELETIHKLPKTLHSALISRIKILAVLDISERRRPQDGRFAFEVRGGELVEFRVSTLPSIHGEKAVLRVLDKRNLSLNLRKQGFQEDSAEALLQAASYSTGMILVTGPTGSGKTTTLYGVLNHLNSDKKNLITIEDPVEYQLDGITQVQVDARADRTFANALRSILRQDPDIVMVGEIRDRETAEIAVHAALTGHMVLSTLHTNSAIGTVTRLLDMGIEPYLIAPSLRAVVAQRLVPKLCAACAEESEPPAALLERFPGKPRTSELHFKEARGCPECRQKGFDGRLPLHEVLVWNADLAQALGRRVSERELLETARRGGFRTMLEDGLDKAALGFTTLEEVLAAVRA